MSNRHLVVKLLLVFYLARVHGDVELWEKDMTDEIYIASSHEGFEHVDLTCSKEKVTIQIKMEDDPEFGHFDGVIYTRGSFSSAKAPCFYDAVGSDNEKVALNFKPTQCHKLSVKEDEKSLNWTVIIQHDDFLIFPGDLAFEVACRFNESGVADASISLADPDPAAKELPKHRKSTKTSDTGFVQFFPDDIRPRKKKMDKPKTTTSKGGKKKKKSKAKTEL